MYDRRTAAEPPLIYGTGPDRAFVGAGMMCGVMQLNGEPVTTSDLAALALCNYGHFTSMRVEGMRVRGLGLHLERLVNDCRALFGAELDAGRVRDLARKTAQEAGDPIIVRVTIFDPGLELGHPAAASKPQILVTTRAAPVGAPAAVRLATRRYERDRPGVKHVGLFATVDHRRQSQLASADDVLFVCLDGRISEAATSNIGFVRDGLVVWPEAPTLPGVTMRLIQDVSHQTGVPYQVAPIRVDELARFRSAFLTNAAAGVRPIALIDDTVLAEGDPLVAELGRAYAALPGEPL